MDSIETTFFEIDDSISIEILKWLDLLSLIRCRLVSKTFFHCILTILKSKIFVGKFNLTLEQCTRNELLFDLAMNKTWSRRELAYLVDQAYNHNYTYGNEFIKVALAAKLGYLRSVKSLSKLPYVDIANANLLNYAIQFGKLNVVKFLVKKIDVNARYTSFLCCAAQYGHLKIVKFLIKKGINIHQSNGLALSFAIENNHEKIARYLFEKGVKLPEESAHIIVYICRNNNIELMKFFIKKGMNIPENCAHIFVCLCRNNNIELLKYLVKNGCDIHSCKSTVMIFAERYQCHEIIAYLNEIN